MGIKPMVIPSKFWGTISPERFSEIVKNGSYLSIDETRTVYRMQDLTPPEFIKPLQVVINRIELERAMESG